MPPGTDRYRDELGVTAPMIFYNGALVRDHEGGRDLLTLTLPRGILWQVHDVIAHAPVDPLFYRDDQLYCLAESFAVRRYAEEQRVPLEVIDAPGDFLRMGGFAKTLLIGHPAVLPTVRAELEAVVGDAARLVMTRTNYLEIIPAVASKGAAIRFLAGASQRAPRGDDRRRRPGERPRDDRGGRPRHRHVVRPRDGAAGRGARGALG